MSDQPISFEEFEREAELGNVVPVVRTVSADSQTPIGAFIRVAGDAPYAFLLESIEGGERTARYSFLGAAPEMIVRGQRDQTIIEKGTESETRNVRLPDFLREYFSRRKLARRPGLAAYGGRGCWIFRLRSGALVRACLLTQTLTTLLSMTRY